MFIKITYVGLDSNHLHCDKNWAHHLLLVGLTAGCKAVRLPDEILVIYVFLKLNSITCDTSILVLNGLLAVIMYCINLVLP